MQGQDNRWAPVAVISVKKIILMIRGFYMLLALLPITVSAQFSYVLQQDIPVEDINGNALTAAWAGGLNAAQYSTIDLNNDNADDLVLFDRMANKVITFLNVNNQYQYAFEFEHFFPAEVTNWLLLKDFNNDGRKDIFTGDVLGIKVFVNTTEPGEPLQWQKYFFFAGSQGAKSEVLLTKGFSGLINLQMQFDDLPSIVDADGDGDLDIFNVRFVGNGTVEFHKNFGIEKYGTADSLAFERQTQTWGNFKECQCGTFALNGTDCPANPGRTQHAGGKSLLVIDANNDGRLDILFSEASCSQLYLLPNEGTIEAPVINSFSAFPGSAPANFAIFPAAFYEDVDFDGKRDLISSPNIYTKQYLESDLSRSNWFYKNTGTDASPSFQLVKKNFLQDQMIDVGDNAVPAFVDYDGDHDLDLLISSNSSKNNASALFLYENTGTASAPEFKLIKDDYLELSSSIYYNVKIQFADVDGNHTQDLVFTGTSLLTGATQLHYLTNGSTDRLDFNNQALETIDFNLTYPENISMIDISADGLADILVGRSNGALEYWINKGTADAPSFAIADDSYVDIGSSVLRQNISASAGDLDGDGKIDLALGDQTGVVRIISDLRGSQIPISELVFNQLTDAYEEANLGGRIWPVIANIFNTDKPAIVAGNILGGVRILRNDEGESLSGDPGVSIYPNPVSRNEIVKIEADASVSFSIYNTLGRQMGHPEFIEARQVKEIALSWLPAGVYLLRFTSSNGSKTRRLVVY
jgi:hypothetical protein